MPVPILNLTQQHESLNGQLKQAFDGLLKSGQFVLGRFVDQFEKDLAEYCGVRHAIGVSSGTDALLVAMMAMDIGPGDEVITTPFTFFSTAGSIARLGAKPVFVDIDPVSFNLEPDHLEGAISAATKAILPVHLFGLSAKMGPIMQIARAHRLKVIEDVAQAFGARHSGRPAGSIGDVGCLSFYPTKNLAAMGDAGACVTQEGELAERIRLLRVHGGDQGQQYPCIGGNFRLDALHAALLSVKLPCVDQWTERRRAVADRYSSGLSDLPVERPVEPDASDHVYNQYTIRVSGGAREPLRRHLDARGIGSRVYYPTPLHLQPCFGYLGQKRGALPGAEQAADEVLSLPIYPELTRVQQEEVIGCIRDFFCDRRVKR